MFLAEDLYNQQEGIRERWGPEQNWRQEAYEEDCWSYSDERG